MKRVTNFWKIWVARSAHPQNRVTYFDALDDFFSPIAAHVIANEIANILYARYWRFYTPIAAIGDIAIAAPSTPGDFGDRRIKLPSVLPA